MNDVGYLDFEDLESMAFAELIETLSEYRHLLYRAAVTGDVAAVGYLGRQMRRIDVELQARKFRQELEDDG